MILALRVAISVSRSVSCPLRLFRSRSRASSVSMSSSIWDMGLLRDGVWSLELNLVGQVGYLVLTGNVLILEEGLNAGQLRPQRRRLRRRRLTAIPELGQTRERVRLLQGDRSEVVIRAKYYVL